MSGAKKGSPEERRRARRTVIQESFNLFLVVPQSGMVRIYMRDISKLGLSFQTDLDLGYAIGQELKARVYINPAFYLPVNGKIVRLSGGSVGVEFTEPASPAVQALGLLQDFFDTAEKAGVLVE